MQQLPGEKLALQVKYQRRHKKEKKRWINRHHMTNKCRGGRNDDSNLLRIDGNRHRKLHELFRNMSWEEIGDTLQSIFGKRDPQTCIEVIRRVSRMKGRAA